VSTALTEKEQRTPTKTDTGRKRRTLTQRDARLGLWLMSPTLIVVLLIVIFPLLWSILLSFQRMRLI
jgi:multiple sugar transport system permease protein